MPVWLLRGRRLTGRDLQRLFAATILLPGVLLTIVGIRAWQQDGALADQRLRERVERAADRADDAVTAELRGWQLALHSAQRTWPPALDALAPTLRRALTEPGAAVLLRRAADSAIAWPATQVAYRVSSQDAMSMRGEHGTGVDAASTEAASNAAAVALSRRARARLDAGDHVGARRLYGELAQQRGRLGGVPADLAGRHALTRLLLEGRDPDAASALVTFYRDLVHGRWNLEATRYRFYSEWARERLATWPARADAAAWRAVEERTLRLADAARTVVERPATAPHADVLLLQDSSAPDVSLLLSVPWLRTQAWPALLAPLRANGFLVSVRGDNAVAWFDDGQATSGDSARSSRAGELGDLRWRMSVSARDPAALIGDVMRWRRLTLVMLLLVIGLLGFGTFLTSHVVRREIEVARLQADFVSAVSHEFRSPLTGIGQLGEMLLRGRVPDEGRRQEYYARITHESARLGRLVENLLQAARIDAGRHHFRAEHIETADWLRSVIAEARTQPALRHATIEAEIPASLPPLVGDPHALASALHNLIDNAVKYSPGVGSVLCEAHADQGHVTIRVRDYGVGMSVDDQRHAFERFRRGHGPITAQVKGTGLGLSLVNDIVRAHGGQVHCESRLAEGTTVSITLAAAGGA